MNCDHNLFLALNFDGGPFMDRLMLTVSGTTMWLPLYALILWLVWRRDGWRNVILFTALMIAALVLSDMISGIFKHNGVLGGLLPDFEPRWRPMFTPALEGLEIAPDSLRALRALAGCAGKRSRVSSAPPPEQGSNPWSGNKKARGACSGLFLVKGGPSGVRTLGLGIKSPLLCQLS
mgnify:CR=1 FL=1